MRNENTFWFLFAVAVFLGSSQGLGETINNTDGIDPLSGLGNNAVAPTAQSEGVNGLESEVLQDVVYSRGGPQNKDAEVQGNDVSNKYGQVGASGSAQAGKIVALATGAALVARGTPMSVSIIPSVAAAGRELIAKGMLEFAQAAASAASEAQNRAIEGQLRAPDTGDASNVGINAAAEARAQTRQAVTNKLNTPEFQKVMENAGLNADYFIDTALSGDASVGDLFSMLNAGRTFDAETLKKAREIQGGLPHGEVDPSVLSLNDEREGDEALGTLGGSAAAGGEYVQGETLQGDILIPTSGDARSVACLANTAGTQGERKNSAVNELGGIDLEGMWRQLSSLKNKDKLKDILSKLSESQLHRLGLIQKKDGPNIFTKAHRSYRSFNTWRSSTRYVAKGR